MDLSLYDILEVSKNASLDDIKKSYKKLCVKHHPDKGGDENQFKKITEAYNVLKDVEKRKIYDTYGLEGLRGGMGGHDMMNDLFGRGMMGNPFGNFFNGSMSRGSRSSNDVPKIIYVDLKDVFCGNSNYIYTHTRRVLNKGKKLNMCNLCKGEGKRVMASNVGFMQIMNEIQCPQCEGVGYSNLKECVEVIQEHLKINIPKHCQEGDRVVLKNKLDEHPKLGCGDLVLLIKLKPHDSFKRIENTFHLYTHVEISLYESLFGFIRKLKLPSEQEIIVRCNHSIVLGQKIPVLMNYGLFDRNTKVYGNVFILPKIIDKNIADSKNIDTWISYLQETNPSNNTETRTIELDILSVSNETLLKSFLKGATIPNSNSNTHHPPQCSQQ